MLHGMWFELFFILWSFWLVHSRSVKGQRDVDGCYRRHFYC